MTRETFEEWLEDYHMTNAVGVLDDDLPDAFDHWIATIEPDELISLAQMFADEMFKAGLEKGEENGIEEAISRIRGV